MQLLCKAIREKKNPEQAGAATKAELKASPEEFLAAASPLQHAGLPILTTLQNQDTVRFRCTFTAANNPQTRGDRSS